MHRPRRDGALGGCVVLLRRDWDDGICVAVPRVEDGTRYAGPAPRGAGARAAVGAEGRMRVQEMEDGLGHVLREGEPACLVVDDGDMGEGIFRVRHAIGEGGHRLHEVVTIANDP